MKTAKTNPIDIGTIKEDLKSCSNDFEVPRTGKRTIFISFNLNEVLCFLDRTSFCVGSSVYTM